MVTTFFLLCVLFRDQPFLRCNTFECPTFSVIELTVSKSKCTLLQKVMKIGRLKSSMLVRSKGKLFTLGMSVYIGFKTLYKVSML